MDYLYDPSPLPPVILVGCKDQDAETQLRGLFPVNVFLTSPVSTPPTALFDVLILTFEPMSDGHLRWYHGIFLPLLRPGGKLITLS